MRDYTRDSSLSLLFRQYKKLRGDGVDKILERLEATVMYKKLDSCQAMVFPNVNKTGTKGYTVLISDIPKSPELDAFIKYHELAHLLLHKHGPAYRPIFAADYERVEHWCDNFALAMIFYDFRFDVMDEDNFIDFLEDGAHIWYTKLKFDYHTARRIVALCKKAKALGRDDFWPLIYMARENIRTSRWNTNKKIAQK